MREIFDLIRDINDPEHPLTLEQLNVVTEEQIAIDADKHDTKVMFTPTIPHCSMATPTPPRVPERGARQQQQQLSTPPGDLSEEGWRQIDDIANVFMRNIYNQSIRVTTSLHRLKKLKSGSVKEKEAFKNIMNKIFLDLTLIGTFDREKIIILAQLLSGIININFTDHTQTSMAFSYIIQSLECKPSSIEFIFGKTALDCLKTKLYQFPLPLPSYTSEEIRNLEEQMIVSMEAAVVRSDATSTSIVQLNREQVGRLRYFWRSGCRGSP